MGFDNDHLGKLMPFGAPSISACASPISGTSDVGEKPSSAGARTTRASAGRPGQSRASAAWGSKLRAFCACGRGRQAIMPPEGHP
jgi:hypothetical protein